GIATIAMMMIAMTAPSVRRILPRRRMVEVYRMPVSAGNSRMRPVHSSNRGGFGRNRMVSGPAEESYDRRHGDFADDNRDRAFGCSRRVARVAQRHGRHRQRIYLDPGHGPRDPRNRTR